MTRKLTQEEIIAFVDALEGTEHHEIACILADEYYVAEAFVGHANAIWNAAFPDEIDDWEYGGQLQRCVINEIMRLRTKVAELEAATDDDCI